MQNLEQGITTYLEGKKCDLRPELKSRQSSELFEAAVCH
jgi:hypothetical protein